MLIFLPKHSPRNPCASCLHQINIKVRRVVSGVFHAAAAPLDRNCKYLSLELLLTQSNKYYNTNNQLYFQDKVTMVRKKIL